MKKQINKSLKSFLLTIVAMFIVFGASGAVFAQDKAADKYPKPDFTEMEEYWDIVEYEYDFSNRQIIVIAKPKKKVVPIWWDITWLDSKGVTVSSYTIYFLKHQVENGKVGDPQRGTSYCPFKRQMVDVKSIKVTENTGGGDAKLAN